MPAENNHKSKSLLVLFDGNALVHRAFHAVPPFTVSKTGEQVGAVYGFARTVFRIFNELKPTHAAVAFDLPAPTFRHIEYKEYKATRKPTDPELIPQFERVHQLVEAMNLPVFEMEGFEADDVLGALSVQAREQGIEVVIVSGDADILQLVSPGVMVMLPGRTFNEIVMNDEQKVQEKYNLKPGQIPDLKSLIGDKSDNIPGVNGIGEKTAVRLLQQFGKLEEIYARLEEVTPPKIRESLRASEKSARQGKVLNTIVTGIPVRLDISCCPIGNYDRAKLLQLCRELEFFSLLDSLPGTGTETPAPHPVEINCRIADNPEALAELVPRLNSASAFAFSLNLFEKDFFRREIAGIAVSRQTGEASYIPLPALPQGQLTLDEIGAAAGPFPAKISGIFENGKILKLNYSLKEAIKALLNSKVKLQPPYFDIIIAAHLLGERSLSLKAMALSKLGIELPAENGARSRQKLLIEQDTGQTARFHCLSAESTFRLHPVFEKELAGAGLTQLFNEVEMPLVDVLVKMELNGVAIDISILREMSQVFGRELAAKETEIYQLAGRTFNINSPQQLGSVLFETLKLPPARRTRSGYSTDASVLEELKTVHPVIGLILGYRQLAKLKSTYLDTLPALVNPETGRLYTTFNQTGTATGRLSSSEPNLQNIPIRGEWGTQIRKAFIAAPPSVLLAADYSQIDLRVLAHLSQDEGLLNSFRQDEDVHTATASELFAQSPQKVTADMRRVAKTVNFGVIYGMSDYGLEQATELSREDASKYINKYFQNHPGVASYLTSTKEFARDKGYVQTLAGRRRYIPEIKSSNYQLRNAAERTAINMPVQGTSADIMKIAMVRLQEKMDGLKLDSKMILQIHDELLFEVPPQEVAAMKNLAEEIMPGAMKLSVPLKIAVKTGKNWGELE